MITHAIPTLSAIVCLYHARTLARLVLSICLFSVVMASQEHIVLDEPALIL